MNNRSWTWTSAKWVPGAVAAVLISVGVAAQTTDNKDVKDQAKPASTQQKRKLKGSFKGQPINSPEGQSLSDVVNAAQATREQKEHDREMGKPKPVVINKADLKAKQPAPAASAGRDSTQKPTAPPAESPTPPSAAPYSPSDLEGHNETYWREKAQGARDRADRAKEALQEADADAKKQENDFYAWDDGQYRDNVIKPAWDRAKDALAKAQKELSDAQEALRNLEDDVRKAGAPPGWIR